MLNRDGSSQAGSSNPIHPAVTAAKDFLVERVSQVAESELKPAETHVLENQNLVNSMKVFLVQKTILTALAEKLFSINEITNHLHRPAQTSNFNYDNKQWEEFEKKAQRTMDLIKLMVLTENGIKGLQYGYFSVSTILKNSYFTVAAMSSLLSDSGLYLWGKGYVIIASIKNHAIFCTEGAVTAFEKKLLTFPEAMSIVFISGIFGPQVLKILFSASGLLALENKMILPKNIRTLNIDMVKTIEVLASDAAIKAFKDGRILAIHEKKDDVDYPEIITSFQIIHGTAFGNINTYFTANKFSKNLELFLSPLSKQAIKDGILTRKDFNLNTELLQELITENGIKALKNEYLTVDKIKNSNATSDMLHQMLSDNGLKAFSKGVMTFETVLKNMKNATILEEILTHGFAELIAGKVTLDVVSQYTDQKVLHEMFTENGCRARALDLVTFNQPVNYGFSAEVVALLVSRNGRTALEEQLLTVEASGHLNPRELAILISPTGRFALTHNLLTVKQMQKMRYLEKLTWTDLVAISLGFDFSSISNGQVFSKLAINFVLSQILPVGKTNIFSAITYTEDDANLLLEHRNNIKADIVLQANILFSEINTNDFAKKIKECLNKINVLNDFQIKYFSSIAPEYDRYQVAEIKMNLLEELFLQINQPLNQHERMYAYNQLSYIQELKNIYVGLIKERLQNPDLNIDLITELEINAGVRAEGKQSSLLNFKLANPPTFFQPNDPFGALKEVKQLIEKTKTKFTPVPGI